MEQQDGNNKKSCTCLDKLGGWMIFISFLALIICTSIIVLNHVYSEPKKVEIVVKYNMPASADGRIYKSVLAENAMQYKMQLDTISSKYKTIIKAQESYISELKDNDVPKDYALLVFGIVMSIAGFFGYKSMHNIKDEAKDIADHTAKDTVNSSIEGLVNKYVGDKFDEHLRTQSTDAAKNELIEWINKQIDRSKIEECNRKLENIDFNDLSLQVLKMLENKYKFQPSIETNNAPSLDSEANDEEDETIDPPKV